MITGMFDLTGKVAIVTGGNGVLGGAMAKGLAKAGAKVGILGRRKEACDKIVSQIEAAGGEAMTVVADVLSEDQLVASREAVLAQWDTVDILVNCAGGNLEGATISTDKDIFSLDLEDIRKVVDLNYFGTVTPTQVFSKVFVDNKKGVIVNISSIAASKVISRVMGYSNSKAAIDNYTKWMAVEMATKFGAGIRVNAIAPGFFIGEQNRNLLLNDDGSYTDRGAAIVKHTPMGRFGEADELVGTLIWLCSDAAKFVTGVVVPVDGGFSAWSGI
jgi:NAD(P)-dependent dehydrogenase (short-subunit alcohol dehydrogenase family)